MKLEEYFKISNDLNKLNHSYLIGNATLDDIKNNLQNILSSYFFYESINLYEEADIIIVKPEGSSITKDQIISMQNKVSSTSLSHNLKVYIIDCAEKLNNYAANSLLKVLEEPSQNIYAFLITSNLDSVLGTIKSRCNVIFLSSEKQENEISEEIKKEALFLAQTLEKYKEKSIAFYNYNLLNKENIEQLLTYLLFIYRDSINYFYGKKLKYTEINETLNLIKNNNDVNKIINKISIINDIIKNLNYNLNINLLIDKLFIKFGGV